MPQQPAASKPSTAPSRTPRRRRILPGFGLTLGVSVLYLSLIVLIPLSTTFVKTSEMGWEAFWRTITAPRMMAAYKISLGASFGAALINAVFGLLIAWVLVRYQFPGKKLVDAAVDLPFALPTAVAGIALTQIYAPNGWLGKPLAELGIKSAYSPLGVLIALTFIGIPFVVRTVQPVLEDLDHEFEEAAASLGATHWQTFRRVIFPEMLPSLLTGFALAFARALGEYGSVVFISGNLPMKTEIVPLMIISKLEQYSYTGAAAIAVVMLVASFFMLLVINLLQRWSSAYRTASA
jgi:sulfate transport system permease protein